MAIPSVRKIHAARVQGRDQRAQAASSLPDIKAAIAKAKANHAHVKAIDLNHAKLEELKLEFGDESIEYIISTPNAIEDDGLIDFVVIKKFSNWKVLLFLIDVMSGKTHLNKNVEIIREGSSN